MRVERVALLALVSVFSAGVARADSQLLDQFVSQQIFSQDDFKALGVQPAPADLSSQEQSELMPLAKLLWNRQYELYVLKKEYKSPNDPHLARQESLLKSAVADYNSKLGQVVAESISSGSPEKTVSDAAAQSQAAEAGHCLSQSDDQPITQANLGTTLGDTAKAALRVLNDPPSSEPSGPKPVADPASAPLARQPVKIAVPGSGFIESIAADPSQQGVLYGVTASSQGGSGIEVIRSNDGGKTWNLVNRLSSVQDSLDDHVAVSGGGKDIILSTQNGALVSTDGGTSFSKLGNMAEATDVQISKDGKEAVISYGFLNTSQGAGVQIFNKQADGSWAQASVQPQSLTAFEKSKVDGGACANQDFCIYGASPGVESVQVDPKNPDVIYAGTGANMFRWEPETGWQALAKGVYPDSTIYNMQVNPSTGQMLMSSCNGIYAGKVDSPSGSSLSDSQVSFAKMRSSTFLWDQDGPPTPTASSSLRTYDVAMNDQNPDDIVATSSTGVYLTRDGGKSWLRVSGGDLVNTDDTSAGDEKYRTAQWLPDGSVEVSGYSGTYVFKP